MDASSNAWNSSILVDLGLEGKGKSPDPFLCTNPWFYFLRIFCFESQNPVEGGRGGSDACRKNSFFGYIFKAESKVSFV